MRTAVQGNEASLILARGHSDSHGLNLDTCSGNIVLLFLQRMLENYFAVEIFKKRLLANL